MKHFIRFKIKLIRVLRNLKFLPEPKRTYTFNNVKYPFYKAPLHSTVDGKLFIDQNELFNSVLFHKKLKRSMDNAQKNKETIFTKCPFCDSYDLSMKNVEEVVDKSDRVVTEIFEIWTCATCNESFFNNWDLKTKIK